MEKKPSIRANAVQFNQKTGTGSITIHGKLESLPGVDDPVIEIFNALQRKSQAAVLLADGRNLINFTILFPRYDEEKNVTVYELLPNRQNCSLDTKAFLAEAKLELNVFYRDMFFASFRQFLDDRNVICGRNIYGLYKNCIEQITAEESAEKKESDISTCRLLIEDFIKFLGLPLPRSKEEFERSATLSTLEKLKSNNFEASKLHTLDSESIVDLLSFHEAFDELLVYQETED